jgi:hypothetical protein
MPKDAEVQAHVGIYAALAKAQAEMTRAEKSKPNPAFRSKYADLAAVQDACMPALLKHGFAVFQKLGRDEDGRHVMTVLAHESGERLECPVPLIIGKNDMQGLGSAVTYARRIGLLCASGVAPEDDDGNAASRPAPAQPARAAARQPDGPMAGDPSIANEPGPEPDRTDRETWARTTIDAALSLPALQVSWKQILGRYTHDDPPPPWLIRHKDQRKAQLSAGDPLAPVDPSEPPF